MIDLNELSTRQKNILTKHYKLPISELEVKSGGLVGGREPSNLYFENKEIKVTPELREYVKQLLKDHTSEWLLFEHKKNKDYKNSKEFEKAVTGISGVANIFHVKKENERLTVLGYATVKKVKKGYSIISNGGDLSGLEGGSMFDIFDSLGSFAGKYITKGLGSVYNLTQTAQEGIPVVNSDKVPDLKTCYEIENRSYKRDIPGSLGRLNPYQEIARDEYICAYKNVNNNSVICGVRGTDTKDMGDIAADIKIALGKLNSSDRYKHDVKVIKHLQGYFPPDKWWWVGVGHSLGGAIVDSLIREGLLKEGVSFNPAVQKEEYLQPTTNRRIYLETDPLYLLMGRFTKYHEVRKTSGLGVAKSHSLDNFQGGKKHLKTSRVY